MNIRFAIVVLLLASHAVAQIDLQLDRGSTGLARTLAQLQTTASVIHVVAHPDDEDGPLLTYCSRGLGTRTLLFSITRGEGGANLISSQFFDELGALRTLEHLKSASYYGNELFYSRATDYGYSKTLEEAKRKWQDGDPILADLVEVVRREQPTIVLSRFRGDPRDGHGHHQMAGVISAKVFAAAADATQFPEQIERGLHPWQIQKLYVNDFKWRRAADDTDWTVRIPTGEYAPALGRSYAQLARYGLGFQRSQGISGHWSEAGPRTAYYKLTKSADDSYSPDKEESILDNVVTSVSGLSRLAGEAKNQALADGLQQLESEIATAVDEFDGRQPLSVVSGLCDALKTARNVRKVVDDIEVLPAAKYSLILQIDRKIRELQLAISQAMGISLECWVESEEEERVTVPGRNLTLNTRLVNPSEIRAAVKQLRFDAPEDWDVPEIDLSNGVLKSNEPLEKTVTVELGANATLTKPYWQRSSIQEPFYTIATGAMQKPTVVSGVVGHILLEVNDVNISIDAPVMISFRDPELGNVRYPVTTLPELSVGIATRHGAIALGSDSYAIDVETSSTSPIEDGIDLRLKLPDGWSSEPPRHRIEIGKSNEQRVSRFVIKLPGSLAPGDYAIGAVASVDGKEYTERFETITARDLGRLTLFKPATHNLHVVDMKFEGPRSVGYIMGSGDEVPAALAAFGIVPRLLTKEDLRSADLSKFDVILVGVRAYAVRPDVRKFNQRLLDYAKAGGTLIVQYQTPEFDQNFGPYPYEMGRRPEEVSEEDAVVTILKPTHPVFQHPNKITASDFDGWLEQRGSKFLKSWDERYTPLLECHDTGQSPQTGGMLVTAYGDGVYVYSAYAWYRQLPNGVPGAYRIFANMLSLGQ